MLQKFPKVHLLAVASITAIVSTGFIFSPARDAEAKRSNLAEFQSLQPPSHEEIASPAVNTRTSTEKTAEILLDPQLINPRKTTSPQPTENNPINKAEKWHEITIKSGDTLSHLFAEGGYDVQVMYKVLNDAKQNKQLSRIFPGQVLAFSEGEQGLPQKVKLIKNRLESFEIELNHDGKFQGKKVTITPEIRLASTSGTIDSSLFLAAQRAGMSEGLTMSLADIFGWDVDFALDIRKGDTFNVLYEQLFLEDEKIGNGRILAASFTNQGNQHQAILYTRKGGTETYYAPDGSSMKGAFLRSPIPFARISSHFTNARKHPVLHRIRAHKGTDYAAARGTPVKATGDGKVLLAGRKGGYGNAIVLKHGHKYTTLYAHLSRYAKGMRPGKRVHQGQIIGYVGSTGLATGPHLHYEFRMNGIHKNPVTVKLPKAESIPKSEMAQFRSQASEMLAQLEQKKTLLHIASADQ